jgi:hypothetical protein
MFVLMVQSDNIQSDAFNKYAFKTSRCCKELDIKQQSRHVLQDERVIAEQGKVDFIVVYLAKLPFLTYLEMMGDMEFPVLIFGSKLSSTWMHITHVHEVRLHSSF